MNKIMVLNDSTTWSMIDNCMIITLSDAELHTLCHANGFSSDIKILEQRTLSSDDIDWFDVCQSFYHACGGCDGDCGNLRSIDEICKYYASYFEEDEDE
jgi:hypothetical protein